MSPRKERPERPNAWKLCRWFIFGCAYCVIALSLCYILFLDAVELLEFDRFGESHFLPQERARDATGVAVATDTLLAQRLGEDE
ncbi:unnamed protein product, partial [Amoebophrya sp. A25]|eukprot:GSA25T00017032001.1